MNRFISIILGICCTVFGFLTIIERGYYSSRYSRYIDFGKYHAMIGAFIAFIGILFIWTSLRKKTKD